MGNKPKSTQKEKPNKIQGRDLFQTPNYGTELLIPFIPKHIKHIWECACGKGKMRIAFALHGCYNILATDLATGTNFLDADFPFWELRREHTAIITNPPYSLKRKFYERCKYHGVPFALLIPADYCGWIINALRFDGAEKIIPTRRIDFMSPREYFALVEKKLGFTKEMEHPFESFADRSVPAHSRQEIGFIRI